MLPEIIIIGTAVDSIPTPRPAIMLVAGPVMDCLEIDTTDIRIDTSTGKDSLRIKCSNANGVDVIINN